MDEENRTSDLRARKRTRTKLMVQAEALRLFVAKGYEQTTVDDIAHAAAMSPRTFFRYFATKEDVVLWDEYDELPFAETWRQGQGDEPMVRLVSSIRFMIDDLWRRDPALLLTRFKLSLAVPEIRARFLDRSFTMAGPYYAHLAEAFGVPSDDTRLQVSVAALLGATMVAVARWADGDGRENLLDLYDEVVTVLAAGLPELTRAAHGPGPAGA